MCTITTFVSMYCCRKGPHPKTPYPNLQRPINTSTGKHAMESLPEKLSSWSAMVFTNLSWKLYEEFLLEVNISSKRANSALKWLRAKNYTFGMAFFFESFFKLIQDAAYWSRCILTPEAKIWYVHFVSVWIYF